jgi:hypothetical protein
LHAKDVQRPLYDHDSITCDVQSPLNLQSVTPDQFAHVKQNLSAADDTDADAVIRNSNTTMQKVLAGLKDADKNSLTEPTSKRALAMAQLEAAIRERKVAKGKSAAHRTKGATSAPWQLLKTSCISYVYIKPLLVTSASCACRAWCSQRYSATYMSATVETRR